MDENIFRDEKVGLKSIYTTYIDKTQEKYSLEGLYESVPYAYSEPEIFALYAATDSLMTDQVYEWQRETFYDLPENAKLLKLLLELEVPIVEVTADMELRGVLIDQVFGERLKLKYNQLLADLDNQIADTLQQLKPIIAAWRLTTEATEKTQTYVPKKTKMSAEKIEQQYPNIDPKTGQRYKVSKSKSEQLPEEINLASSTQVAILLYDILKCNIGNSRATGEDELKQIVDSIVIKAAKTDLDNFALTFCSKILERRGIAKLVTTYIDIIPDLAKHWPDGRIRYRLNSTGTDTGRFASGGKFKFLDADDNVVELNSINSQNMPSHGNGALVRLLFRATPGYKIVGSDYSGQELRLAAYISQDKTLLDAYAHDQDAYAIIASQVFNCTYNDCREFYPAGTKLEIDGQQVVSGTGEELKYEVDSETGIVINYYDILATTAGDKAAKDVMLSDKIISDEGTLLSINNIIELPDGKLNFIFTLNS